MTDSTITMGNVRELWRSIEGTETDSRYRIYRKAFTNPIEWRAVKELVRRGSFVIAGRSRSLWWEMVEIHRK